jgi:hypothetical protein
VTAPLSPTRLELIREAVKLNPACEGQDAPAYRDRADLLAHVEHLERLLNGAAVAPETLAQDVLERIRYDAEQSAVHRNEHGSWSYNNLRDQWPEVDRHLLLLEVDRLRALINTPHTHDFIEAVRLEMPHQRERWGTEHDAGKDDTDWAFLVGFLLGKAAQARKSNNIEKAKHHAITAGAACGNYFLQVTGESTCMRPGREPPAGDGA